MNPLLKSALRTASPRLFRRLQLYKYERQVFSRGFVQRVNRLTENHLVIDLGANVGLVSECMARRGARVISFEPNGQAFAKLGEVASRYPNMTARQVAAGTKNRLARLYHHVDSDSSRRDLTQASTLLADKPNASSRHFEDVQEIDLAEFLKSSGPVEIMKIDIEGYEIELINHLLDQCALENVKTVFVETHEKQFEQLVSPTERLKTRIAAEGMGEKFDLDWH